MCAHSVGCATWLSLIRSDSISISLPLSLSTLLSAYDERVCSYYTHTLDRTRMSKQAEAYVTWDEGTARAEYVTCANVIHMNYILIIYEWRPKKADR